MAADHKTCFSKLPILWGRFAELLNWHGDKKIRRNFQSRNKYFTTTFKLLFATSNYLSLVGFHTSNYIIHFHVTKQKGIVKTRQYYSMHFAFYNCQNINSRYWHPRCDCHTGKTWGKVALSWEKMELSRRNARETKNISLQVLSLQLLWNFLTSIVKHNKRNNATV